MGTIKNYSGYKFMTEQDAKNAVALAQEAKNLPNDAVEYWVNYQYSELDDFYFIIYDDGIQNVLGEPVQFEVNFPNPYENQ